MFTITKMIEYTEEIAKIAGENNKYYINTYGCALNENDSEKIAGMLEKCGFVSTDNIEEAKIIAFNTCCIRENAENTLFGNLGEVKKYAQKGAMILVGGCMMQQEHIQDKIRKSYPFVSVMFGTHTLQNLPKDIYLAMTTNKRIEDILDIDGNVYEGIPIKRLDNKRASITITYGCNNFCTYCIVPYVRGRERSRKAKDIIAEAKDLVKEGYIEITLLGQNVNSYIDKEEDINFAKLLDMVASIEGLKKVRFVSPHPKDFTDDVIYVMAKHDNISKTIHYPLQSGSNNVLKKMNRKTNFIIAGVAAMLLLAPAPASAQFGGLLKKAKQKVEKKVKQEVKDHIADRRGQIVGKIDQKVYEKKHNAEQKVKNKLYETEEELVDKAREKVTGLEPFEENFVNDGIRFIRFKPDEVEKIAAKMARKNRDDLAMTSPGGNIDWRYGIHMLDYPCDSLGPESLNDELMYWCFKFSYALYKKNPEKLAMAFHGLADPWNILVNKHDPKRTNYVDASEDELAIHFICTDWGKYIKARVDSYEKMLFTDKGYPAEEVSTEAWEWCINQVNKSPKGSALGGMYMIRITNIRKQLIIRDKISPSDPQWEKLELLAVQD